MVPFKFQIDDTTSSVLQLFSLQLFVPTVSAFNFVKSAVQSAVQSGILPYSCSPLNSLVLKLPYCLSLQWLLFCPTNVHPKNG